MKSLYASTREAYLCYLETEKNENSVDDLEAINPNIQNAINDFSNVFENPTRLPSQWDNDHHILLQPSSSLVNVRPYKCLQY